MTENQRMMSGARDDEKARENAAQLHDSTRAFRG
jgi:hypothetical protein